MNTTRPYGSLDRRDVAARLPDRWMLDYVARTGSTNADLLARWASAPPDGEPIKLQLRGLQTPLDWATACAQFPPMVRVADEQSAGRGRQGRPWRTVPGEGLLFSIAVVLPCSLDTLSGLSLAVGLGIVEGLRSLPGITPEKAARIGLKWPNDILLDDAKLGGVLIETSGHGPHACAVVIGIGLNLRGTPAPLGMTAPSEGMRDANGQPVPAVAPGLPPACLAMLLPDADGALPPDVESTADADVVANADADAGVDFAPAQADVETDTDVRPHDAWRATVLCAITQALSRTLSVFSVSGFAAMRDAWWQAHRFAGREVSILDGGIEKLSGIAAGVDPRGQLLIAPLIAASHPMGEETPASGAPLVTKEDTVGSAAARTAWIAVQAGDVSLRLAGNARVRHRLLIDSGNSRLKWTLTDAAGRWLAQGAADKAKAATETRRDVARGLDIAPLADGSERSTETVATAPTSGSSSAPDALTEPHFQPLRAVWRTLTPPDEIWVSNVAGAAMAARIASDCAALWPTAPLHTIQAQASQCGLTNGYLHVEKLGSDRWAGMIAARTAYPGEALLIATFGTATTIDTVTADGAFVGGWIAPGWSVMLRSLGQHTAQLPTLSDSQAHAAQDTAFARETRAAIIEGCRQAQAGMILSAWRTWCKATEAASVPRRCIVAGGAATEILPALPIAVTRHDDLVLHGLSRIAREATQPEK